MGPVHFVFCLQSPIYIIFSLRAPPPGYPFRPEADGESTRPPTLDKGRPNGPGCQYSLDIGDCIRESLVSASLRLLPRKIRVADGEITIKLTLGKESDAARSNSKDDRVSEHSEAGE